MPCFTLTCPHCRHGLRTANVCPPGSRLKCPKCGHVFAASSTTAESPSCAKLPDVPATGGVSATLSTIAAAPSLGPDAEEFADFDRASQPRPLGLKSADAPRLLGGLLMLLLVVFGGVAAVVVYNGNQPQNLIIGSWKAVDHPHFAYLEFYHNGAVRRVFKPGDPVITGYRFVSRNTVEIGTYDTNRHYPYFVQFHVRFDERGMTTEDKHLKAIYHWRRIR
jgi:hypothetical protein